MCNGQHKSLGDPRLATARPQGRTKLAEAPTPLLNAGRSWNCLILAELFCFVDEQIGFKVIVFGRPGLDMPGQCTFLSGVLDFT